jgi:hypothetical protein
LFGLAGELGDRGDRLVGGAIGSGFDVGKLWSSGGRIEAAPHVSVSSDKFGWGPRFFDFGVGAVHVGFLAFERRSGLFGPMIGFAPALPADREAGALQGRAERAGARDEPLSARPVLAVAILFSFAHQAKVRRRWREQEIPAPVVGRLINGPWKADSSGTSP